MIAPQEQMTRTTYPSVRVIGHRQVDDRFMNAADIPVAELQRLMSHARWIQRKIANNDIDAESDAMLGLTKAIRDYNPAHGATLHTYASYRVRGEVLDGLRDRGHLSRSDLQKVTRGQIEQTGAMCSPVSIEIVQQAHPGWDVADPGYDWQELLADRETGQRVSALWRLIDLTCSPRTAQVLHAVFGEGVTMQTAADRIGVTESRVSQIVKKAVEDLRVALGVQVDAPMTWKRMQQIDRIRDEEPPVAA